MPNIPKSQNSSTYYCSSIGAIQYYDVSCSREAREVLSGRKGCRWCEILAGVIIWTVLYLVEGLKFSSYTWTWEIECRPCWQYSNVRFPIGEVIAQYFKLHIIIFILIYIIYFFSIVRFFFFLRKAYFIKKSMLTK